MLTLGWVALAAVLAALSGRWIVLYLTFLACILLFWTLAIAWYLVPGRRDYGIPRRAASP